MSCISLLHWQLMLCVTHAFCQFWFCKEKLVLNFFMLDLHNSVLMVAFSYLNRAARSASVDYQSAWYVSNYLLNSKFMLLLTCILLLAWCLHLFYINLRITEIFFVIMTCEHLTYVLGVEVILVYLTFFLQFRSWQLGQPAEACGAISEAGSWSFKRWGWC